MKHHIVSEERQVVSVESAEKSTMSHKTPTSRCESPHFAEASEMWLGQRPVSPASPLTRLSGQHSVFARLQRRRSRCF